MHSKLLVLISLILFTLAACTSPELKIKQEFDFTISVQKYRDDVSLEKPLKLIFFIHPNDNYDGIRYNVSYFIRQGRGEVKNNYNVHLLEHEQYIIYNEQLEIHYTPFTSGDHIIELEFTDNFGNIKEQIIRLRAE